MVKTMRTFSVPALRACEGLSARIARVVSSPQAIRVKADAAIASVHKTFAKAVTMGVKIGLGTDAAVYPHGRNAEEFHQMVDLGMKPIDALKAGTSSDADLLGLSLKVGTLESGKLADVVAGLGAPPRTIPPIETRVFLM